jgi:thiol-disulfide isomerase/thioredoxin
VAPQHCGWFSAERKKPDQALPGDCRAPVNRLNLAVCSLTKILALPSVGLTNISNLHFPTTMKNLLFGFALALAVISPTGAGELGSAAAPLNVSKWVKGKPVDLAAVKGKQVVVVEFWATWCPPCRTSIPHLTEMQKKFKDVIFIGVTDEESDVVEKFVAKMGDKMDYVVAIDEEHQTSTGYMKEFGINGIPHAFIVDKEGRVVWHGHPMAGLDQAVEQVIAGKLDVEKAKKHQVARKKLEAFYLAANSGAAAAKLDQLGKELEALDAELGGIQPGKKFEAAEVLKIVKLESLMRDYQIAFQAGRGGTNLARIEKLLEENAPQGFDVAEFKESLALSKLFSNYYYAATGRRGAEQLVDYARELAAVKTSNANALNEWAWVILTDEGIKTRDLELATTLAKAGVVASAGKEPAVLDTYARALFDSGQVAEAIEQQQKAIAVAKDIVMKRELEETLKKYQEKSVAKTPPGA